MAKRVRTVIGDIEVGFAVLDGPPFIDGHMQPGVYTLAPVSVQTVRKGKTMAISKDLTKAALEKRIGAILVRKRAAIGPGQTRFGWFSIHPCRDTWRGATLADVAARLDAHERERMRSLAGLCGHRMNGTPGVECTSPRGHAGPHAAMVALPGTQRTVR